MKRGTWLSVLAACGLVLSADSARAHWCTNIWDTPSRIVVKPERATIFVGGVGDTETLRVWVRNNFPYMVTDAEMRVTNGDFSVTITPNNQDIYPGEEVAFDFSITRTADSGDDDLRLEIRVLYQNHGGVGSWRDDETNYWTHQPPTEAELRSNYGGQRAYLAAGKLAELYSTDGLDWLIDDKCGYPRLMFNPWGDYGGGTWYSDRDPTTTEGDWREVLRSMMEVTMLNAADSRVPQLFIDHMDDPNPFWRGSAAVLGAALSPNAAVQARIETMASTDACVDADSCSHYSWTASDDARVMAKSALIILGQNQYQAEVETDCLGHSNSWPRMACAAALGIAGQDDPVINDLMPLVADSYSFRELTSGYFLQVVATHRRGGLGGTDCVSFFGEQCEQDTTNPRAPTNFQVVPGG